MRLIDADALCKALLERWDTADKNAEKVISEVISDVVTPIIASMPTILVDNYAMGYQDGVRTVLKEVKDGKYEQSQETTPVWPKQGEWKAYDTKGFLGLPDCEYECSVCKIRSETATNFCPECGAYMRYGKYRSPSEPLPIKAKHETQMYGVFYVNTGEFKPMTKEEWEKYIEETRGEKP